MSRKLIIMFIIVGFLLFFFIYFNNQKESNEFKNNQTQQKNEASYNKAEENQHSDVETHKHNDEQQYLSETTHEHDEHGHHHVENEPEVKKIKKPANNFTLKTLKGDKLTLTQLKGKKVLLNFWTTWCPPCQEEMPQIQHFYETYGKQYNMEVVAINITDQDSGIDVIKEFADYYHLTFPIVLDEKGEVSKKYEVITIPTNFIIDEEGNIVREIIGPVTEEMLIDIFNK